SGRRVRSPPESAMNGRPRVRRRHGWPNCSPTPRDRPPTVEKERAVAAAFLRKFLGNSKGLPADVTAALADLERLARERPVLRLPAEVLAEVLPWLFADPVREALPTLTAEEAAAKLASGVPLLRGTAVELDAGSFRRRWRGICAAVSRHQAGDAGL